eukprot:COSAG02_NODE_214_length_28689_cov_34.895523_21_plen_52_part_00
MPGVSGVYQMRKALEGHVQPIKLKPRCLSGERDYVQFDQRRHQLQTGAVVD